MSAKEHYQFLFYIYIRFYNNFHTSRYFEHIPVFFGRIVFVHWYSGEVVSWNQSNCGKFKKLMKVEQNRALKETTETSDCSICNLKNRTNGVE